MCAERRLAGEWGAVAFFSPDGVEMIDEETEGGGEEEGGEPVDEGLGLGEGEEVFVGVSDWGSNGWAVGEEGVVEMGGIDRGAGVDLCGFVVLVVLLVLSAPGEFG